jgi:hypothetical protein
MKKLITTTILLLVVASGFSQLRTIKGMYFLITSDSVVFPSITLYPDNSSPKNRPIFVLIDTTNQFNNKRLLTYQTAKVNVFFKVYQSKRAYREWASEIPFTVNFFEMNYNDVTVRAAGTGMEGYLPDEIKSKLKILFDVPSNKCILGF